VIRWAIPVIKDGAIVNEPQLWATVLLGPL
jgi:hypothetical protein